MKTCPYCAEEIKDKAVICKHCHSNLELNFKQQVRKATDVVVLRLLFINVLVIVSFFLISIIYLIFEPTIWYALNKDEIERVESQRAYDEAARQAQENRQEQYQEDINEEYYYPGDY